MGCRGECRCWRRRIRSSRRRCRRIDQPACSVADDQPAIGRTGQQTLARLRDGTRPPLCSIPSATSRGAARPAALARHGQICRRPDGSDRLWRIPPPIANSVGRTVSGASPECAGPGATAAPGASCREALTLQRQLLSAVASFRGDPRTRGAPLAVGRAKVQRRSASRLFALGSHNARFNAPDVFEPRARVVRASRPLLRVYALVLCVDEKSQIQRGPNAALPLKKGRCGTMTHVATGTLSSGHRPMLRATPASRGAIPSPSGRVSRPNALTPCAGQHGTHNHPTAWLHRHPRFVPHCKCELAPSRGTLVRRTHVETDDSKRRADSLRWPS